MSRRAFFLAFAALSFVVAGVVSYYASSHPDGLEYVAETTGFLDTAEEHAAADSPLADYGTRGVEDERLSGGVAGVTGAVTVLLITGGLTLVLRRRGASPSDERRTPVDSNA